MPLYRVTFIHARHRTRFEVLMRGPTPKDARLDAAFVLNDKLADSAGRLEDWSEGDTEEILLDMQHHDDGG